jgi:hypothetical protein
MLHAFFNVVFTAKAFHIGVVIASGNRNIVLGIDNALCIRVELMVDSLFDNICAATKTISRIDILFDYLKSLF